MASRFVGVAYAFLAFGAAGCLAAPGHVRGSIVASSEEASDRSVSIRAVEASLTRALDEIVRGGAGLAAEQRLARIEARMWPTFQALPKNSMGRLQPRAVRHIIHGYFAKEHGWLINGLEHHGMQQNVSEVHEVGILQDKAPAFVEALLEAWRSGRGLSLGDTVAMAAALERLIFDESVALLQASYTLNGQTVKDDLDARMLHEVLSSYLMVFEIGIRGNVTDVRRHRAMKEAVANAGGNWPLLVEFERDAVLNFDFESFHRTNPFVDRRYSFRETSRIVEGLAQDYGKWQNTECRQMKEELMELDLDGSGRVPLKLFYSRPETADYQFTESVDYLRQVGALDEASGSVRIPNYMAGPSNCIARSTYYSVCCLSDCEGMMSELESTVRAPIADPEALMAAINNLTSSSADMRLTQAAAQGRLEAIAGHNGGRVPLHGRLFAEFLHFAFPTECPYPHISEEAAAHSPGHWAGERATASQEERQLHLDSQAGVVQGAAGAQEPATTVWSQEEVLPVLEPPKRAYSARGRLALWAVQLAAALAVLRTALAGWRSVSAAVGSDKGKHFVLPMRI